jgi:hypothetical protein
MTTKNRTTCPRCGRNPALADENWIRFGNEHGLPHPPPTDGLCLLCALKDPRLKEPMEAWRKEAAAFAEERTQESFRNLRQWIARPLEAIDRFVDSLR